MHCTTFSLRHAGVPIAQEEEQRTARAIVPETGTLHTSFQLLPWCALRLWIAQVQVGRFASPPWRHHGAPKIGRSRGQCTTRAWVRGREDGLPYVAASTAQRARDPKARYCDEAHGGVRSAYMRIWLRGPARKEEGAGASARRGVISELTPPL